jgi:hypothetical protein
MPAAPTWTSGLNLIKLFFFFTDKKAQYARAFVHHKPFQLDRRPEQGQEPTLEGNTCKVVQLGYPQIIDVAGNTCLIKTV